MNRTTAKVVLATRNPAVPQAVITTVEVYAPRFLLAEINTHGVLAKSAASSRAIPVRKRIEAVKDHGFVPEQFGKNKPGMQATEELLERQATEARKLWEASMRCAISYAGEMERLEMHKQHANRILEPYAYYHGIITGTEWDNFYRLRLHPDAQPEFRVLSKLMDEAMKVAPVITDSHHLPYTDDLPRISYALEDMLGVSAARCARISYTTHDGQPFRLERDLARCAELIQGGHMSPFDHPAAADNVNIDADANATWSNPRLHGRYWGWVPDRVRIEAKYKLPLPRRDSFAAFKI